MNNNNESTIPMDSNMQVEPPQIQPGIRKYLAARRSTFPFISGFPTTTEGHFRDEIIQTLTIPNNGETNAGSKLYTNAGSKLYTNAGSKLYLEP